MRKKYIIELLDECNSEFKGIMAFGLTQEKQISVELIPEESLRPYTEPDMEQVRKEAYDKGYTDAAYNCHERCAFLVDAKNEAYQRGYETAKHECEDCPKQAYTDAIRMEGYQKGLSDAWDAARKIANIPYGEEEKVIGSDGWTFIINHTASEAIEKIRQYEQEKEMDGLRQNIQTIVDQCGYSLDEIVEVLAKMKETNNG